MNRLLLDMEIDKLLQYHQYLTGIYTKKIKN
jgi:hypothetical protein